LPNEIISAETVNQFKNRYDNQLDLLNKKEFASLAGFQSLLGFLGDL
jgi:hypothetical protein